MAGNCVTLRPTGVVGELLWAEIGRLRAGCCGAVAGCRWRVPVRDRGLRVPAGEGNGKLSAGCHAAAGGKRNPRDSTARASPARFRRRRPIRCRATMAPGKANRRRKSRRSLIRRPMARPRRPLRPAAETSRPRERPRSRKRWTFPSAHSGQRGAADCACRRCGPDTTPAERQFGNREALRGTERGNAGRRAAAGPGQGAADAGASCRTSP